jgi:hypothetical protein
MVIMKDVYPNCGLLVMMAKIPDLEKTTNAAAWVTL